jgi:hypothetical protein
MPPSARPGVSSLVLAADAVSIPSPCSLGVIALRRHEEVYLARLEISTCSDILILIGDAA